MERERRSRLFLNIPIILLVPLVADQIAFFLNQKVIVILIVAMLTYQILAILTEIWSEVA
jgi:hypothetical protein